MLFAVWVPVFSTTKSYVIISPALTSVFSLTSSPLTFAVIFPFNSATLPVVNVIVEDSAVFLASVNSFVYSTL